MPLPRVEGLRVAVDTETSGLYEDQGARISVVSWAYREDNDPDAPVEMYAVPFDQGFEIERDNGEKGKKRLIVQVDADHLPLGPKHLPRNHRRRVDKWMTATPDHVPDEPGEWLARAPNKDPEKFMVLAAWLGCQELVLHNAKFDLLKFRRGLRGREEQTGVDLSGQVVADTQIEQHITDPRFTSALKPTSVRLELGPKLNRPAGTEADEAEALNPWKGPSTDPRYDLIPWHVMKGYAQLDAGETLVLHEYQQEWYASGDPIADSFQVHIRREFALMKVLYAMEVRGVGYDKARSLEQVTEINKRLEKLRAELPFRPTGPGARKFYFGPETDEEGNPTGNLGRVPYSDKMTAGGQASIDEEVVHRLAKDGAPYAELFAEHEKNKNAASKWYQAWADMCGQDGRLRTCHRQTTVVSGRLSVEGVQLHAIPQPYQTVQGLVPVIDLFQAKPGHRLWSIDVSQAEIRIATALAKCKPMLEQYRQGRDSHDAANLLMFGDELLAELAAEPDGTDPLEYAKSQPKWHEYRQVAKRCNLGILYAAGVNTVRAEIAKHTGITYAPRRVGGWIDDWKAAFPEMVVFHELCERAATSRGWVRLINGRIRYFSDYEPTRKAANQVIQGSQAEALKECMIEIERRFPGILLLDVHDAVWIEVEDNTCGLAQVETCKDIIVETFENMFERRWEPGGPLVRVPFAVDAKPVGSGKG